jgi:hypothetical protein
MATIKSESTLDAPTQTGTENSRFNGRKIKDWTAVELRAFASILNPEGGSRRQSGKASLCREIYRLKDQPLGLSDQRALREFIYTRSIRAARAILAGETYYRVGPPLGPMFLSGKNNLRTHYPLQECIVCLDLLGTHHFPILPSSNTCPHTTHTTCIDCFASHIENQITINSLTSIPCPEPDCMATLSHDQMRAYAPESLYTRYNDFTNLQAIVDSDDYVACASAGCLSGALVDKAYAHWMVCAECGEKTCVECKTLWHDGVACEENQVRVKKEEAEERERVEKRKFGEEEATKREYKRLAKRCPGKNCGVPIQKNEGCDHMTCKLFPRLRREYDVAEGWC